MAATLVIFALAPMLVFTGCEKRVSTANIETVNRQQEQAQKRPGKMEQVQEGLTMKEVEAVLGAPARRSHGKIGVEVRKDFELTTWTYEQDGQAVELSFVDGKLQGKVPKFGEPVEAQAPLKMNKEAAK